MQLNFRLIVFASYLKIRLFGCNRVTDDELVFTTLHYLMAPAVLGDAEAVAVAHQPGSVADQPAPMLQPVHILGVDEVDHLVVILANNGHRGGCGVGDQEADVTMSFGP